MCRAQVRSLTMRREVVVDFFHQPEPFVRLRGIEVRFVLGRRRFVVDREEGSTQVFGFAAGSKEQFFRHGDIDACG